MPVTTNPSDIPLEAVNTRYSKPEAPEYYIKNPFAIVGGDEALQKKKGEVFKCSFPLLSKESSKNDLLMPAHHNNGFVGTALQAYNQHHHLIIRPDDVWTAILSQFNFFVNANAEKLRHLFVAHEGQKVLSIQTHVGLYSWDFGKLAVQMGELIQEHVVDPNLREWIMPDFTTTTTDDRIISSVIMMSTLKKYFKYCMFSLCGLPAVTLLGEKDDWEKLLVKIEKLAEYGEETSQWRNLLKVVLTGFVETFNNPDSKETKDFWMRISQRQFGGSGPSYISGWITAFCFFSSEGVSLYRNNGGVKLGDTAFHRVQTDDIPVGYADVPVLLSDNGIETKAVMVAGLVGSRVTGNHDTVQPQPAWWISEDASEEDNSTTINIAV
ncbi:hypothetical protein BGZ59_001540 [Podila verticillata]|uniref:DUF4419 domain-containing protein n=1 Tax=Podila verticillata NRRL 6337 TaxID=1069443 RepID=A0A086TJN8_9FUNG|nr:hypothetical protein BGZ59_001540 [Podila verticillata]KFH62165.1 hypothetical protein MVEG_11804 [Podila verticillata NRRL 6337]